MNELQFEKLKQTAHPIVIQLTEKLIWQPDKRFDALVAEVPKPIMAQVKNELSQVFTENWDKKTIRKAPQTIRRGAGLFAQMENRQLLFSNQPDNQQANIMAAWWPWGPDAPASLRLFIADPQTSQPKTGWREKLKAIFG
ncbi:hypothetical protein N7931_17990 [Catenovulum sp. 2E275]|uniref:hypothetical protein n=1 Tax=Catenovulum sp. 2E275 TaxID=2980497 RepID=UPI0021D13E26|nr:hypothetical protein [Catenovulum sp. 2E275]MCU4677518.1 hypothetical protein [Catenovulum sp. 2E275]